jgi:mannosyltransferase
MRRPTAAVGVGGAGVVVAASVPELGRSLWIDEAFTYSVASAPTAEFLDLVPFNGGNMALYYGVIHLWSRAVDSDWMLRLPSLVFAAAAVPAFALLARRLVGRTTGSLATALLALNGSVVFAAQELRSYSLALLLVITAWLALDRAVERPGTGRWVLYGVVAALSVWAHLFSVLYLAAQAASLVAAPRRSRRFGPVAAGAAAGALVVAPVGAMALSPDAAQPDWIGLLDARRATDVVQFLSGRPGAWVWAWGALCAVGLVVAVGLSVRAWRTRGGDGDVEPWRRGAVVLWAVVPVGLALAIAAVRPFLVGRYLVGALPAGALLAALAVVRLPRPFRPIGVVVSVLLSVPGIVHHLDRDTADWRSTAAYVMARAEPGDAIVFEPPHDRTAFEIYALRSGTPPPPEPVVPPDPWGSTRRLYTEVDGIELGSFARVWVVTRGPLPPEVAGLTVVSERSFPHTGRVVLVRP